MSEPMQDMTPEQWAGALCARWGFVYGPAADTGTAAEIQREIAGALRAAIAKGKAEAADDESPGTIGGRLKAIYNFAETRLGHSPISSKCATTVVIEELDRLLRERAEGISYTATAKPAP